MDLDLEITQVALLINTIPSYYSITVLNLGLYL